jgi:hypothetical protein
MLAKFLKNDTTNKEEFVEYLPANFVVPTGHSVVEREITDSELKEYLKKPDELKQFNGLYPHVNSIVPDRFFVDTVTNIVITGGNFDRTTQIILDGIPQETICVSDTELHANISYDAGGIFTLTICNGGLETEFNLECLAGFTPTLLSGLSAWFDASTNTNMTEANGHVSAWSSAGGPSLTLTQPSLAEQAEFIDNQFEDKGMLYFSSGDEMQVPFSETYSDLTVFLVYKTKQSSRGCPLAIKPNTQTYGAFSYINRFKNGDVFMTFDNSSGNNTSSHSIDINSNKNDINVFQAKTTGDNVRIRLNCANEVNFTENNPSNLTGEYIKLGELPPGGSPFEGYIGEVIIYNGSLSDVDAKRVEDYLASKWGVTSAGE